MDAIQRLSDCAKKLIEAGLENDSLRARVAELEEALQPFTAPDNAPLMIMSDAHMAKLVDDARAVLAKERTA